MKVRYLLLLAFVVILISPSICVSVEAYKPGDSIHFTYNPHINVGTKPKFIRYTLFDPTGNVVYEEDHPLTYVKEIIPIIGPWVWFDEYDIKIAGFSAPGTWKLQGRLFSEALWIIEVPDLFPFSQEYQVEEVSLIDNLLAPWYISLDMGFFIGRKSIALPVHPMLIGIIIGIVIALILIVKIVINIAVPSNGGNKK